MPELDPFDSARDAANVARGREGTPDQAGKPKKKDQVRSVWISFVGRIVAPIIGAVASVVLGIFILQRYQDAPAPPAADTAAAAPVPRPHGRQALAVLPLDNFSRDPAEAYFAQGTTEVLIFDLAQIKGWRSMGVSAPPRHGRGRTRDGARRSHGRVAQGDGQSTVLRRS